MRKLVLGMAALLAFAACGKSGIDGALDKLASFKDRICACKDTACVEEVRTEWLAWMSTHDELKTGTLSASQQRRGDDIRDAVEACEAKLEGRPEGERFATALAAMKGVAATGPTSRSIRSARSMCRKTIGRVVNRKVVPIVKQPRGATLNWAETGAFGLTP